MAQYLCRCWVFSIPHFSHTDEFNIGKRCPWHHPAEMYWMCFTDHFDNLWDDEAHCRIDQVANVDDGTRKRFVVSCLKQLLHQPVFHFGRPRACFVACIANTAASDTETKSCNVETDALRNSGRRSRGNKFLPSLPLLTQSSLALSLSSSPSSLPCTPFHSYPSLLAIHWPSPSKWSRGY